MTLRHHDAIGGIAIVVLGAVAIYGALTTRDPGFGVVGPGVLPTAFGVLIIAVGLWLLATTVRRPSDFVPEPLDARPLLLSALALALYLASFAPVGFLVASPVFLVAQARILGSRALLRDVIAATGFVLAVYLVFDRLLTVDLPSGVLPI